MTDSQYKGKLMDELRAWREVRDLAIAEGAKKVQEFAEQQIDEINQKLKF